MNNARILVVDDDPKLSSLVRIVLECMGRYEVREENRSSAAMASAQQFRPDLVVMDVDMPGKDGGAVAGELRDDPYLWTVPILFVSALVGSMDSGLRGSRKYYLSKPVDPHKLLHAVRCLLA